MILNADTLDETSAWFGKPGNLVPIPNQAGGIALDHERMTRYQTTITGGRIAQYAPTTMRAWKITIPELSPVEKGNVIAGFRSIGYPWALATIDGWMHNIMTPGDSMFRGIYSGTVAGPTLLPAESTDRVPNLVAPSRLIYPNDGYVRLGLALCLPGVPVTVSSWVKPWTTTVGHGMVFIDGAGSVISGASSFANNTVPAGTFTRVSRTATPPTGAAWVGYDVRASEAAAPAISWTTQATAWTEGMGCHAAIPSAPKLSLSPDVDGAYWDLELELAEVN